MRDDDHDEAARVLAAQRLDLQSYALFIAGALTQVMRVGPLDGAALRSLLYEVGLLELEVRNEPCGEDCTCFDAAGRKPFECFHPTPALERALARAAMQRADLLHHLHGVVFQGPPT